MSPDSSRDWGVVVLTGCADVFVATFWPGPVNGLTLLTILLIDAVLLIGLIAVPKIVAAYRCQARVLAGDR